MSRHGRNALRWMPWDECTQWILERKEIEYSGNDTGKKESATFSNLKVSMTRNIIQLRAWKSKQWLGRQLIS